MKYHYEYRLNKKGAECFRTADREEATAKLAELSAKRPWIYTMQSRSCRLNRYGVRERNWKGEDAWSLWF